MNIAQMEKCLLDSLLAVATCMTKTTSVPKETTTSEEYTCSMTFKTGSSIATPLPSITFLQDLNDGYVVEFQDEWE